MNAGRSVSNKIKKFFRLVGPGMVTGARDDDPSGIAIYSQAGARFGTSLLWTAIVSYPLMVSIQEMCARIELVTNSGLTGVIKRNYKKRLLYLIVLLSYPSITLNIGADIAGMGQWEIYCFQKFRHLFFRFSLPACLCTVLYSGTIIKLPIYSNGCAFHCSVIYSFLFLLILIG